FLYSGGTYTTITPPGVLQYTPPFLGNGGGTEAGGINNSGEIVGTFTSSPSGTEFGYTYSDSDGLFTNTSISDSGNDTVLYGVNDDGLISGYEHTFSNGVETDYSFLYNGGFMGIAYPGATSTHVQGVNDSGEAVGFYTLGGVTYGFTYSDGAYTSIMYPDAS